MTFPRLHPRFSALIVLLAIWAPAFIAQAEQPPAVSPPPAQVKVAPPPRSKPQIIYWLPRNSNYAATLHSQAKTQTHPLPIDNSMSPSLQMSRAAANEAAAREQQQQQLQQQQLQQQPKVNSSRQQRIKPSKFQSNQPQMRKPGPGKGRGPGASRGKGRKK